MAYIYIYSDILSDILSGIYSDILSGILSGVYSDILSGILSGAKFPKSCFLVKVQSEKAPILFEVLVKGGLSLRCASQFQNCIKRFHSEVTVSKQPISLDKSLYNSWLNQAHIDYGSTHTNHMWQSKISAM